jgi:hypothetical protein
MNKRSKASFLARYLRSVFGKKSVCFVSTLRVFKEEA